jgi:hypothetical protein
MSARGRRQCAGVVCGLLLPWAAACGGSPAAASGASSLTVRLVDDVSGQPIVDPVFGITVRMAGTANLAQRANNGFAVFTGISAGTYTLTSEIGFGYMQMDAVSVRVAGPTSVDARLTPIEDLIVTEVVAEGQGSIPDGGTILVPADGVNLRVRGRYQTRKSPWPAQNQFFVDTYFAIEARSLGSERSEKGNALSADEWEIIVDGYKPCTQDLEAQTHCYSPASDLIADFYTPSRGGRDAGAFLALRRQPWTLNFRLGPGCCTYP